MPRRGTARVEVEENPNCHGLPLHVFPAVGLRRPVFRVSVYAPASQGPVRCRVTGWSSKDGGSPCPAYCVPVEDSGSSETVLSFLVYGGDWGLRFRPEDVDEPWSVASAAQFGEPCLLLAQDPLTEWLEVEARRLERA